MIAAQVDQIVLGCTHYPFFIPQIKKLIPDNIQLIDPAPAIALRTKAILEANHLEKKEKGSECAPEAWSTETSCDSEGGIGSIPTNDGNGAGEPLKWLGSQTTS